MQNNRNYFFYATLLAGFLTSSLLADSTPADVLVGQTVGPAWDQLSTTDIFSPSAHDLSIKFLKSIFGFQNVQLYIDAQYTNPLVVWLMRTLNLGVILAAGAILSYNVIASTVRTAQDGGMSSMGKVNGLTLLRVFGGFSVLLPYTNQGFSFIQMLVIWVVQHGVGLADHVWNQALTGYQRILGSGAIVYHQDQDYGLIKVLLNNQNLAQPQTQASEVGSPASTLDVASSAMCLATLKHYQTVQCQKQARAGQPCQTSDLRGYDVRYDMDGSVCHQAHALCFGSIANPMICGRYALPEKFLNETKTTSMAMAKSLYNQYVTWIADSALVRQKELQAGRVLPERDTIVGCKAGASQACPGSNHLLDYTTLYFLGIKKPMLDARVAEIQGQHAAHVQQTYQKMSDEGWVSAGKAIWTFSAATGATQPVSNPTQICQGSSTAASDCLATSRLTITHARESLQQSVDQGHLSDELLKIYRDGDTYSFGYLPALRLFNQVATQKLLSQQTDDTSEQSGSSEQEEGDPRLDVATYHLLQILFYKAFDGSDAGGLANSPFGDGSACVLCWFRKNVSVDAAVNNLEVLLIKSFNAFTGLYFKEQDIPWDDGQSTHWSHDAEASKNSNPAHTDATVNQSCTTGLPATHCFKNAWDADVIQKNPMRGPLGLLGTIGTIKYGVHTDTTIKKYYNPLLNMRSIGVVLLNTVADFWYQLPQSVLNEGMRLVSEYRGQMITMGWLSGLLQGFALMVPDWGVKLAVFLKVITQTLYHSMQMFYMFDVQSMMVFVPIAASLSVIIFTLGAIFAVWVPLIPFLVFLLAVIGWGLSVIEAVVAAPLVAMGITYPEGHDFLGQSQQSVVLLLGVFIRPVVLLISFIIAFFVFYVAMNLTNLGFANLLASMLSNISKQNLGYKTTLLLALMSCYAYVLIMITEFAFATTYKVPEKILIWIGGQPENSQIAQKVDSIKRGFQGGVNQIGEGGKNSSNVINARSQVQYGDLANEIKIEREEDKGVDDQVG